MYFRIPSLLVSSAAVLVSSFPVEHDDEVFAKRATATTPSVVASQGSTVDSTTLKLLDSANDALPAAMAAANAAWTDSSDAQAILDTFLCPIMSGIAHAASITVSASGQEPAAQQLYGKYKQFSSEAGSLVETLRKHGVNCQGLTQLRNEIVSVNNRINNIVFKRDSENEQENEIIVARAVTSKYNPTARSLAAGGAALASAMDSVTGDTTDAGMDGFKLSSGFICPMAIVQANTASKILELISGLTYIESGLNSTLNRFVAESDNFFEAAKENSVTCGTMTSYESSVSSIRMRVAQLHDAPSSVLSSSTGQTSSQQKATPMKVSSSARSSSAQQTTQKKTTPIKSSSKLTLLSSASSLSSTSSPSSASSSSSAGLDSGASTKDSKNTDQLLVAANQALHTLFKITGESSGAANQDDVDGSVVAKVVLCPFTDAIEKAASRALTLYGATTPADAARGAMNEFVGQVDVYLNMAKKNSVNCDWTGLESIQSKIRQKLGSTNKDKRQVTENLDDKTDTAALLPVGVAAAPTSVVNFETSNIVSDDTMARLSSALADIMTVISNVSDSTYGGSKDAAESNEMNSAFLCPMVHELGGAMKNVNNYVTPDPKDYREESGSLNAVAGKAQAIAAAASKNNLGCRSDANAVDSEANRLKSAMDLKSTSKASSTTVHASTTPKTPQQTTSQHPAQGQTSLEPVDHGQEASTTSTRTKGPARKVTVFKTVRVSAVVPTRLPPGVFPVNAPHPGPVYETITHRRRDVISDNIQHQELSKDKASDTIEQPSVTAEAPQPEQQATDPPKAEPVYVTIDARNYRKGVVMNFGESENQQ